MIEIVVIAPLDPMTVGAQFERGAIPRHLTVLPKVRVPESESPAVMSAIREIAAATAPITATSVAYASFGGNGEVRVTTIEASAELRRLHVRLLEGVGRAGAVSVVPAYNGGGYRPHVTHTDDEPVVRPGVQLKLSTLAVLDCTQPIRRISATAILSGSR